MENQIATRPACLDTTDTSSSLKSSKSFFENIIRKDRKVSPTAQVETPKGRYGLTTLYEPSDQNVVADLIFVHGLNGGSQSTWMKGDESTFWPKAWLPSDDAFRDVRIHTFGYHSDLSKESVLHVQDFSRALLGAIHDAPCMASAEQKPPIVLVGHSMGGLVMKNAFVLGHHLFQYAFVVDRIKSMFFLATPHQGAAISQSLNRILSLHGSRPFVNDLFPSSPAIQLINDEFPLLSQNLQLFSFFETRPMNYIIGRGLIVEKHAAVLNFPNERRTYLDANHRECAKFTSPDDPSYHTVRNALATVLDEHRGRRPFAVAVTKHVQQSEAVLTQSKTALGQLLGVQDIPDDDWLALNSVRVPGSCGWLFQTSFFSEWLKGLTSPVYWLRGRPGAGKSVISSAVISHLREHDKDCCFFFFARVDKNRNSPSSFLRSMAFQMASLHPEILQALLDIMEGQPVDKTDASTVWRKLFVTGILKINLSRPQYWVIDGIDEARGDQDLMMFLAKAQELWPLCIFVTSRHSVEPYTNSMALKIEVVSVTMTEDENHSDISSFLDVHYARFPAPTLQGRKDMAQHILRNAHGCFLWARLVVKELLQVQTASQVERVLSSNPSDIDKLYLSILHDMSEAKFNHELTGSILTWAACSIRPLYMDELQHGIELDIKDEIGDMERSVNDCCGNLVYVDKLKRLQLVHSTVRDLLTREDTQFEFQMNRSQAHRRLALVCLECLTKCANEATVVTGPRSFRRKNSGQASTSVQEKPPFANYAAEFVFSHLSQAKASDDELLSALSSFLVSNGILFWIEHVATHLDLGNVVHAGKVITQLLRRQAQHSPPIRLSEEISGMARWATDLPFLVAKFGTRMTATPSSIHHLIPPFCPRKSAIYISSASWSSRPLLVEGVESSDWDECLSAMLFAKPERPTALLASSHNIVVGTSTGQVILYDQLSCQQHRVVQQKEAVWNMAFSDDGKLLAIASARSVTIWDLESGTEVRKFPTKVLCLALAFDSEDTVLWAAFRSNTLVCWNVITGALHHEPLNWTVAFEEEGSELHARAPFMAVFCLHMRLLAIIYRGEDLILWGLDEEHVYDIYEKDTGSRLNDITSTKLADGTASVWGVAFSAAVGTSLIAAAYHDGDLVVYDTDSGSLVSSLQGACAQSLCSSPDGRTLATGDSTGSIQLLDFQSLKVLYKIQFQGDALKIRSLAFTSDNLRLVEIRGSQCRVWEPAVLLRQGGDDESSDANSMSTAPLELDYETKNAPTITSLQAVHAPPAVLCGRDDGAVYIYDVAQAPQGQELFVQTWNAAVTSISFDPVFHLLVCKDLSGLVTARTVNWDAQEQKWTATRPLLEVRLSGKLEQMLPSGKHARVLLSTAESDTLWPLLDSTHCPPDAPQFVNRLDGTGAGTHWVTHSSYKHLIHVSGRTARIFDWSNLDQLFFVDLAGFDPPYISSVILLQHPRFFGTVSEDLTESTANQRSAIQVWDLDNFDNLAANLESDETQQVKALGVRPSLDLGTISTRISKVIGLSGTRFVFLDKHYWICSVDLGPPTRGVFRKPGGGSESKSPPIGPLRGRGRTSLSRASKLTSTRSVPNSLDSSMSVNGHATPPRLPAIARHFFFPNEWISLVQSLYLDVGSGGEIYFARRSELAVVRRGLDLELDESGQSNLRRVSSHSRNWTLPRRPAAEAMSNQTER